MPRGWNLTSRLPILKSTSRINHPIEMKIGIIANKLTTHVAIFHFTSQWRPNRANTSPWPATYVYGARNLERINSIQFTIAAKWSKWTLIFVLFSPARLINQRNIRFSDYNSIRGPKKATFLAISRQQSVEVERIREWQKKRHLWFAALVMFIDSRSMRNSDENEVELQGTLIKYSGGHTERIWQTSTRRELSLLQTGSPGSSWN